MAANVVIDNILCFLTNKIGLLGTDTIVKLCTDTYSDDEIRKAKDTLFDLCADDSTSRFIRRQGPKMSVQNIEDMVKLLQEKGQDIPVFVVQNLSKLPPITFDSIDVSVLLTNLKNLQTEVDLLKGGMRDQMTTTDSMRAAMTTMNDRIDGLEKETVTRDANLTRMENSVDQRNPPFSFTDSQDAGPAYNHIDETQVKELYADVARSKEPWHRMESVKGRVRQVPIAEPVQPRKPRGITGKATGSGLTTVNRLPRRLANVFISRFDPDVTADQVKRYLEEKLNLKIDVESVKTRFDTYASFHVKCTCEDPSVFMDEELWPDKAYVRWWREKKEIKSGARLDAPQNVDDNGGSGGTAM